MLRACAFGFSSLWIATAAVAQTNFPPPVSPPGNPQTAQKELLGMALFFEEQLSSTSTVACATCHDLARGGIDTRTVDAVNPGLDGLLGTADDQNGSPGVGTILWNGSMLATPAHGFGPSITKRRAPTVVNSGYHTHLLYDGSKTSLEQLIAGPILNPVEMAHYGRTWNDVTQKLAASTPLVFASNLPARLQNFINGRTYPDLFNIAFGTSQVTQPRIVDAIANYLRTLNSDQSKWDLHLHGQAQLTAQEQLGLNLFTSPANGATSCHTCHGDFEQRVVNEGPIAGQMTMVSSGPYGSPLPIRLVFHNVGIRPPVEDPGRQTTTGTAADAGKFRVASLRNVELTAPYFHNGRFGSLRDVLDFYDRGGDFHVNQAANLTVRNYTIPEKDAIVALLATLTDPRLAAGVQPFDKPTLGSQNGRLVTSIGQGEFTPVGQLQATAPFAPRLGEAWFRLTLTGATPGTPAFLMWDRAPATSPQQFNLELGMTPAFEIFAAGTVEWTWMMPGGILQAPLPLPNVPALSGQTLFAQWLVLEPSQSWPLATSNALRIPLL
ncbi:MAG TPA: cytochrome c peroxidase [Planctomycetota bacterium]